MYVHHTTKTVIHTCTPTYLYTCTPVLMILYLLNAFNAFKMCVPCAILSVYFTTAVPVVLPGSVHSF